MSITLVRLSDSLQYDIVLNTSDRLRTSITVSLLTEARARDDDPAPSEDRSGYWGNSYPDVPGWELGSRLWLLAGRKLDADTLAQAETYARDALKWLIDDKVSESIEIAAERVSDTVLGLAISIQKPGDLAPALQGVWEISLAS